MTIEYYVGAELDPIDITWKEADESTVRDFSSGWTFTVLVGQIGQPAEITKTTGITGSAPPGPNVVIDWDPDELDVLVPGEYVFAVIARFTTGQDAIRTGQLTILDTVRPAA
jgi:hypothetical protein